MSGNTVISKAEQLVEAPFEHLLFVGRQAPNPSSNSVLGAQSSMSGARPSHVKYRLHIVPGTAVLSMNGHIGGKVVVVVVVEVVLVVVVVVVVVVLMQITSLAGKQF